jgi:hypothetical protein
MVEEILLPITALVIDSSLHGPSLHALPGSIVLGWLGAPVVLLVPPPLVKVKVIVRIVDRDVRFNGHHLRGSARVGVKCWQPRQEVQWLGRTSA